MNPKHARKFNFNRKHSLAAAVVGREKKAKYLLKLGGCQTVLNIFCETLNNVDEFSVILSSILDRTVQHRSSPHL